MKSDTLFIEEFEKFMIKNAQVDQRELSELNDSDLPQVERYDNIPYYYLKSVRDAGETGFYLSLDSGIFHALRKGGFLSSDATEKGPFTAKDIRAVSELMKASWSMGGNSPISMDDEEVQKMIGKEMQTTNMAQWGDLTTVNGFSIVQTNPTLKMLGLDEEKEIGFLGLNGMLAIQDESFGEVEVEYLMSEMAENQRRELHNLRVYTDDDTLEGLDNHGDKWRERYDEAVSRAIEERYPSDEFPEGEDVGSLETPMGAEIDLVPSPEDYFELSEEERVEKDNYPIAPGSQEPRPATAPWSTPTPSLDYDVVKKRSELDLLITLQKIAGDLDSQGKYADADAVDRAIRKLA